MTRHSHTILVLDDEPHNVLLLRELLRKQGHKVVGTSSPIEALQIVDRTFDLVLSDVMMPEMNGFQFVEQLRSNPETEDIPVIIVTTLSDKPDRLRAVQSGANDFITKPVDAFELEVRTASMLRQKRQQDEIKLFQQDLAGMVEERTSDLQRTLNQLHTSHIESILHLAAAAEYKDEDTSTHIKRMSRYSALIAKSLGQDDHYVDLILRASPMHDVGKIGIPDDILLKPGPLTAQEWETMKTHTTIGGKILGAGSSEYMLIGTSIALTHHEKWNGTGYPAGLSGENIPLCGLICAVADVFDALTSKRPYKDAFPEDKALSILREGRGVHFSPRVLDAFLDNLDAVRDIRAKYCDDHAKHCGDHAN